MHGKNSLGEIDPYGDNAHVLPLRLIDENDSFHLGTFDAVCGNLLGCDLNTPEGQTTFRENCLGKRCAKYTSKAAEIAARIITETNG